MHLSSSVPLPDYWCSSSSLLHPPLCCFLTACPLSWLLTTLLTDPLPLFHRYLRWIPPYYLLHLLLCCIGLSLLCSPPRCFHTPSPKGCLFYHKGVFPSSSPSPLVSTSDFSPILIEAAFAAISRTEGDKIRSSLLPAFDFLVADPIHILSGPDPSCTFLATRDIIPSSLDIQAQILTQLFFFPFPAFTSIARQRTLLCWSGKEGRGGLFSPWMSHPS